MYIDQKLTVLSTQRKAKITGLTKELETLEKKQSDLERRGVGLEEQLRSKDVSVPSTCTILFFSF